MNPDSNTDSIRLQQANLAYTIRQVQVTDATALQHNLWIDRSFENSRSHLQRVVHAHHHQRGLGIVAEHNTNQALLAYGQIMYLGRCFEIGDLIVDEAIRSHGIGTAIIQHLAEVTRKISNLPIEIGVTSSNIRALALYQRLGFEIRYQRQLQLDNGEETILYLLYVN